METAWQTTYDYYKAQNIASLTDDELQTYLWCAEHLGEHVDTRGR